MKIGFLSANQHKIDEIQRILSPFDVEIVPVPMRIEELQTEDVDRLVRDKLTKAFEKIGRPLFVEHTGLYVAGLNGLPAGLTQIFWDRLGAERFSALVAGLEDASVTARTVIGYCDGRKIHVFEGVIEGTVSPVPVGPRDFQWDCVFIPNGQSLTFAEMGSAKDEISMRRRALDKFVEHLESARSSK